MISACRKRVFTITSAFLLLLNVAALPCGSRTIEVPVSGEALPGLQTFDKEFVLFMRKWEINGGSLAIARRGKLVYARGYGFASIKKQQAMQPDSVFRLASLSKSITAVAILKLCQDGKLKLDDKAFRLLQDQLRPCRGRQIDPAIYAVTIKQLLQCTAGWSIEASDAIFSPMFEMACENCDSKPVYTAIQVIRWWASIAPHFPPGTRYSYNSLESLILGEVVTVVAKQPYADYVTEKILRPVQLRSVHPGHTLKADPKEPFYYARGNARVASLYPAEGLTTLAYGGDFMLEKVTAAAGWVGTTIDMVKFVATLSGERPGVHSPLNATYFKLMLERPPIEQWKRPFDEYYAMGFEVQNFKDGKTMYSRHGSLAGSITNVAHRSDGFSVAFGFNGRPQERDACREEAETMIWRAIDRQKSWPDKDLFGKYQ